MRNFENYKAPVHNRVSTTYNAKLDNDEWVVDCELSVDERCRDQAAMEDADQKLIMFLAQN